MAKEGQYVNYTGEEALAQRAFDLEYDDWWEFYHIVCAVLERPDVRQMIDDYDTVEAALKTLRERTNALIYEYPHLLHARLCRVFPHLADIFTFLIWPEFMPTPSWVDERGMPLVWAQPQPRTSNHDMEAAS